MRVTKNECNHCVYMDWVVYKGKYKLPVYYDSEVRLVDSFHDYIVYLAKKKLIENAGVQAYKSEIEAASYALKSLLNFLSTINCHWDEVDDFMLLDYREWTYNKTLHSSNSKQDEKAAKRSVNIKLRHIYNYYCWAQEHAGLIHDRIGVNDHPIQSSLPLENQHASGKNVDKRKYPICYRRIGEKGGAACQYTATPNDKIKLMEYFTSTQSLDVAERNIIIMEIADQVGWRKGSINDLTVDQFEWDKIESELSDSLMVTPTTQKFGYEKSFDVPIALAAWVARYIDSRNAIMKKNGWSEKTGKGRIFLNLKTGKPLGHKTITQIFSKAFTEIGAPKGRDAGIHSFRRKFTQEATSKEIHERRSRGLSTAVEDVLFAIARKLGQESIYSQEPYQKAISDDIRESPTSKLENRIKELEQHLAKKEIENSRLRNMVTDRERGV